MTVNRNHIKSEGILSLESSNVSISATDTWHSFITVNRRTILYSHNTSSSSETAGSPVQRILFPFECKSFSLPFRRCVQVTSPNYVTMDKKFNCTHPGIFFFPSLLTFTANTPITTSDCSNLFFLSSFQIFQDREVHADCVA